MFKTVTGACYVINVIQSEGGKLKTWCLLNFIDKIFLVKNALKLNKV